MAFNSLAFRIITLRLAGLYRVMKEVIIMKLKHIMFFVVVLCLPLILCSLSTAESGTTVSGNVPAQEFLTPEENSYFDLKHTSVYVTDPDEWSLLSSFLNSDGPFARFIEYNDLTFYPETIMPLYELNYFEESNTISLQPAWGINMGRYSNPIKKDSRMFAVKTFYGTTKIFDSQGFEATEEKANLVAFMRPFPIDDQNNTFVYQSFDYADNAKRIMNLLGRDTFVDPKNVKAVVFRYIDNVCSMFYIKDDLDECFIEAGFYDENITAAWDRNDYVYSVEDVVSAVQEARKILESKTFSYNPNDFVVGDVHPIYPVLEGHSVGIDDPAKLTADNILNTWDYLKKGMVKPNHSSEQTESVDESEEDNDSMIPSSVSAMENSENGSSSAGSLTILIILCICFALAVAAIVMVILFHRKKLRKVSAQNCDENKLD